MTAAVVLPAVLDIQQAGPLRDQLLALRGHPVTVDASAVDRLGALCLQVLISARKTWDADGKGFALNPASAALNEQLAAYGCADLNTDPVGATR